MKHAPTFNQYAKAAAKDLLTAVPRCYKAVFNSIAENTENKLSNPIRGIDAAVVTAMPCALGFIVGGVAAVLAIEGLGLGSQSIAVRAIPYITGIVGSASAAALGINFCRNVANEIFNDPKSSREEFTPMNAKAFPEVNKLRREDRGMKP